MTTNVKLAVALALAACAALPAHADVQLGDRVTLSGFGTAGFVRTDTDQAQFGKDRQPGGADRNPDALVDSNLGVQLTGKATSWLSGTVQVLAQRRDAKNMDVEAEWAFIKIQPIGDLSLRIGRMTMPTFLVSDFRNVGYANTWLRAPNEVYALNVFRRLDGADLTYRLQLGASNLTAQVLAGDTETLIIGTKPAVEDVRGGNLTWEYEGVTLRAGYMTADTIVRGYPKDKYTFKGFGAAYDRGNLIAQAEYVQRRSVIFAPAASADGRYVMAGYRIGEFTPYASYAKSEPETPGPFFHLSDFQTTRALGLRWDAFSSAAFKFQVEKVDTKGTPGISFTGPVSGKVNAVSAAIDFTF